MRALSDDGGGSDEVERRARQRLDALDSKHGLKLASGKNGKHLEMTSNGSRVKMRRSVKKRRERSVSESSSSGEEDSDSSASVGPSSSVSEGEDEDESDRGRKSRGKRRKAARATTSSSEESSEDDLSSESEDKSRRNKTSGRREKKSGRRKERMNRKVKLKGKRSRRSESGRDKDKGSVAKKSKDRTKSRDTLDGRHKKERRSKYRKEGRKKKVRDFVDEAMVIPPQEDIAVSKISRTLLQEKMDAQEQQKAMIRHNAEMAKARLASGDMKRARDEQAEMQRLYGAVDWRAKKKLRSEKKRLERTIAAGDKLANLEEREMARMDAFRVALGLPTAEAQRQAEWRAEATRALAEQEATMKETPAHLSSARSSKHSVIGPRLPHRSPT